MSMSLTKSTMVKDVPDLVMYIIAIMLFIDAIIVSGLDVAHILGQWWSSVVVGVYFLNWILAIAAWLTLATSKTESSQIIPRNPGPEKVKIFSS